MKIEDIIRILKNEQECVAKAACGFCYRDCENCELVMEDSDIIGAYDAAIEIIGSFEKAEKTLETWLDLFGGMTVARIHEICKADAEGRLIVLPCKVGSAVYTIKEDYFSCVNCQYKEDARYNPKIQRTSCGMEDNRHCPLVVEEHIVGGFDVSKSESGDAVVSSPGEWGYEGLEPFYGFDGRCYFTREEAEAAMEGSNV